MVPTQEEMETTARLIKQWFTDAGTWVSDKFRSAKDAIVSAWSNVANWFDKNVASPIGAYFSELWEGAKENANRAWSAIEDIFGKAAGFFERTFSDAWAGVVSVFSSAGSIFLDIKDGILTAFKEIVNGLIRG